MDDEIPGADAPVPDPAPVPVPAPAAAPPDARDADAAADAPETPAAPDVPATKPRGLARIIAKAGYGTRPQADTIVRTGRVRVDGVIVREPQTGVAPGAEVRIDGQRIIEVPRRYFAFHKPQHLAIGPGERDKRRATAELFPSGIRGLRPADRLDAETTGLVLLSNDATWNANAAGGAGLEKEYQVRIAGTFTELEFDLLTTGITIPKLGFVRPLTARIEQADEAETLLRLVMMEGKNRQIRRLFGTLRHAIITLHRVRIGPVSLGELGPGEVRPLTVGVVETVRRGRPKPRREAPRRKNAGQSPGVRGGRGTPSHGGGPGGGRGGRRGGAP